MFCVEVPIGQGCAFISSLLTLTVSFEIVCATRIPTSLCRSYADSLTVFVVISPVAGSSRLC
jgi:hypothetical protein